MFIGREREIAALNAYFKGGHRFKIAIVEGRTGVGKTALCEHFLDGKPALKISRPSKVDAQGNLSLAFKAVHAVLGGITTCDAERPDNRMSQKPMTWEGFFSLVNGLAESSGGRPVIFFDDYPTLCAADPLFVDAFSASLPDLKKAHSFLLLSGTKEDFLHCVVPTKMDKSLSLHTDHFTIGPLGYRAALIGSNASAEDLISCYERLGGLPARHANACASDVSIANVANGRRADGDEQGDFALLSLLARAVNPFVGLSGPEICRELSLKPIELRRLFNRLKSLGYISRVRAYSASVLENGTNSLSVEWYYRLADGADRYSLVGKDAGGPSDGFDGDFDYQTLVEIMREWVWDAGREGMLPFEFDEISYYLTDATCVGDARKPKGVLAISEQTNHAALCQCLPVHRSLTQEAIDACLAEASKLPYGKSHCVLVTIDRVNDEVLEYAAQKDTLTIARLTGRGFTIISNPWQLHSERYQRMVAKTGDNKEQAG